MDPKILACLFLLQLLVLLGPASSDLAKDKAECADKLVALGPCLGYVNGGAKAPTPDCCSALKGVLDKSRKCLCLLVKDSNDPSLGFKINATLALGLPDRCSTPANISECPELLNLAPNSPDAKVFQDFVNSAKGSNTTSPAAPGKQTNTWLLVYFSNKPQLITL
nr:protein YLS3-like [Ipomoea batatas]GMD73809.1 protein YLS3-like [Ipomoea batatas]